MTRAPLEGYPVDVTVRREGWWRAPRRGDRPGSWHYYRQAEARFPKRRTVWRSLCERSVLENPRGLSAYRLDLVVTCPACLEALRSSSS